MKTSGKIKTAIILILITAGGWTAFADDGGWNKSFSLQGGSIYTEEENTEIALLSELLVFDGRKTTAFFLFENTSDSKVTVKCGFPVRNDISSSTIDGYVYIWTGKYGGTDIPALRWFETVPVQETLGPDDDEETIMFAAPEAVPVNQENRKRSFISPSDLNEGISLSIIQDGRKINIDKVLLEREIDKGIQITYHFQHNLEFKAGEKSIVKVEYTQDLFYGDMGGGMGETYRWDYVISTGRTWKGSIGKFCLLVPLSWNGNFKGLDNAGSFGTYRIYFKNSYEPGRDERFSLNKNENSLYLQNYVLSEEILPDFLTAYTEQSGPGLSGKPAQSFVKEINASSSISQKVSVFTKDGIINNAGFGAVSAFDGYTETAWCENAAGYGIGEYIEFTLTKAVMGFEIVNGFTRFTLPDWVYDSGLFEKEVRDDKAGLKDYYSLNGSVSEILIVNSRGKTLYTLELENTREKQLFLGIELDPGKYRIVINGAWPGTKWKDTCIGEITFIEAGNRRYLKEIENDEFLMSSLYSLGVLAP